MENIDDWLYIVFLAIAGISSLFSSVKRKRVQQPIPDQEDTDLEPPFGEPMEEMPSQRTFRMPDEVFQTRPADSDQATLSGQPAGADPAALMGKRRSRLKTAQGKMPDTPTPAAQAPTTPPAEAAPERSWLDNPSDLRRAILCAEILNRKYD
ncbi:MAG: hypothetical protein SPE11_03205 [Parabacteroides sp.]|nr:hypothetical protein [Parabacteroides distasonis]MDD6749873.1 hypothetical protein [bacterium]MDY4526913.1 hypothetical protein [Parabacteroides sp.]MDD7723596.1 hypothetical protein [bacterium]MDY4552690.1 hypothetical protein [Parabacteroides sp.]